MQRSIERSSRTQFENRPAYLSTLSATLSTMGSSALSTGFGFPPPANISHFQLVHRSRAPACVANCGCGPMCVSVCFQMCECEYYVPCTASLSASRRRAEKKAARIACAVPCSVCWTSLLDMRTIMRRRLCGVRPESP